MEQFVAEYLQFNSTLYLDYSRGVEPVLFVAVSTLHEHCAVPQTLDVDLGRLHGLVLDPNLFAKKV